MHAQPGLLVSAFVGADPWRSIEDVWRAEHQSQQKSAPHRTIEAYLCKAAAPSSCMKFRSRQMHRQPSLWRHATVLREVSATEASNFISGRIMRTLSPEGPEVASRGRCSHPRPPLTCIIRPLSLQRIPGIRNRHWRII